MSDAKSNKLVAFRANPQTQAEIDWLMRHLRRNQSDVMRLLIAAGHDLLDAEGQPASVQQEVERVDS